MATKPATAPSPASGTTSSNGSATPRRTRGVSTPKHCWTECWPRSGCLTSSKNFILFDDSRAGGTRKIVARNHQVLGVNNAVESVLRQEELKRRFPAGDRFIEYPVPAPELLRAAEPSPPHLASGPPDAAPPAQG